MKGTNELIAAARVASQLGRTLDRALDDTDLTPAGYRLLAYLVTGDVAGRVLAAKLAVSRPTVTATLDWLEPRGYVTRTPDRTDGRKVNIAITAAGLAALEAADVAVTDRLLLVTASLPDHTAASIITALAGLHDALNVYRERTAPALAGNTPAGSDARSE